MDEQRDGAWSSIAGSGQVNVDWYGNPPNMLITARFEDR